MRHGEACTWEHVYRKHLRKSFRNCSPHICSHFPAARPGRTMAITHYTWHLLPRTPCRGQESAPLTCCNIHISVEETETVNQNTIPKSCIAVAYCLSMITIHGLNKTQTRIYYLWRIEIIRLQVFTNVLRVANYPIYMQNCYRYNNVNIMLSFSIQFSP